MGVFEDIQIDDRRYYYGPDWEKEMRESLGTTFNSIPENAQIKRLAALIGKRIYLHQYRYLGDERGEFVRYFKGVYHRAMFQNLNYVIQLYYDTFHLVPTSKQIGEVRDYIKRNYKINTDFEVDHDYINFTNCLLKIREPDAWTTVDHDPKFHTFVQIPWEYRPNAIYKGEPEVDCPEFHSYLTKVCSKAPNPEQMYKTVWEVMGYAMQLSVRFKKCFLIISKKSNTGKSTFLNILTALLGNENTSKTRLDKITAKGFGAGAAAYKLLNYYDDLPRFIPVENLDIWKSQIDGYYFDYERKYQDATKHRNILKQIYAANSLPKMNWDLTIAVRVLILWFNYQFNPPSMGGEQIKFWEEKYVISNKREMEGILYNSVVGLRHLFERDEFVGGEADTILDQALSETDTIYKFVKECCKTGYRVPKGDRTGVTEDWYHQEKTQLYYLFTEYQDLVGDTNQKITKIVFTKVLKKMGYAIKKIQYYDKDSSGVLHRKYKSIYLGVEFMKYPDYLTLLVMEEDLYEEPSTGEWEDIEKEFPV